MDVDQAHSRLGANYNGHPDEDTVETTFSESEEEEFGPVISLADGYVDGDEEEPLFTPPLYIQRYCQVEETIEDFIAGGNVVTSLVDLGCAELKFLIRAKNGSKFRRIVGVDQDEFLLGSNSRKINPGVFEMINKRDIPLKMEVYAGDATVPDARLVNVDVVSAIELIEHMDEPTHVPLVSTVFGVMQPLLAIFTTPNVEYNPLFPGGSIQQRRHWDHRFEWTREQLQAWGNDVVKLHPYTVKYTGVGEGPPGTAETHGYCSQTAIFTRDPAVPRTNHSITVLPHKLMREVDYPWAPPKTLEEEILEIMDAECYSQAKDLKEAEENAGRFNQEWFTFSVADLYEARWRLQSMLKPPSHLDYIRRALGKSRDESLKYDAENDTVSYQLLGPEHYDEDLYDDGPNIDMGNYDHLGRKMEMDQLVEELNDPEERDDDCWG
ncbi:hypothetical protein RvY_16567 [Ramazzottius varieornatus]|uniref:Small RNA 2'-O-methyltransferase n=1 Tax=Ramazzottius varieornatus TaxID=947166 RepID=A0A1D1VYX2_RAMVA|nr:hypothetical protein RvY_16567 [Ramazzottius varieornatus]